MPARFAILAQGRGVLERAMIRIGPIDATAHSGGTLTVRMTNR